MKKNQKGQVLMYMVVLLSLIFLIIGVATPFLFVSTFRSLGLHASGKAFYGAQSGVQEAMLELFWNRNFTGKTLELDGVEIEIVVTPAGGGYYDFESIGRFEGKLRRVEGVFKEESYYIDMISWQEVGVD